MSACLQVGKPSFLFQKGFEERVLGFQLTPRTEPTISFFDLPRPMSDKDILAHVGRLRTRASVVRAIRPQGHATKVMRQGFAFTWSEVEAFIASSTSDLLADGRMNFFHMLGDEGNATIFVVGIFWDRAHDCWRVSFSNFGFFDQMGASCRWESGRRVFFKTTPTTRLMAPAKRARRRVPGKRHHRVLN